MVYCEQAESTRDTCSRDKFCTPGQMAVFCVTKLCAKAHNQLVCHTASGTTTMSSITCIRILNYNFRVTINISGEIFETFLETLERYPTTVLGSKRKRLPFFCHRTSQYFFQRNRGCFDSILFFYQSKGELCFVSYFSFLQSSEHIYL